MIKTELHSAMDSLWLDDELHWARDIQKFLINKIIDIWKVLLLLKYISIFIVVSGYITMIYIINISRLYLSLYHLFRIRPTSNYFRPSPLRALLRAV
jgi:hypothetical protein